MCGYVSTLMNKFHKNILPILSAQCRVLQSPANGMVTTTSRRLSTSIATYTCNSGFELLDLTPGSNTRTCQPNGMWSGAGAHCISK